jgi:hypothetical protein
MSREEFAKSMSMPDGGKPPTKGLVWRPNTSEMTPQQVQTLRNAFAAMAQSGTYAEIAGIHGLPLPMYGQHGTGLFLAWNRAYVVTLERALHKNVGEVAIPAWDWWNKPGLPEAFSSELADGMPNSLYSAEIPPAVIEELSDNYKDLITDGYHVGVPHKTIRNPGGEPAISLPSPDSIQRLLSVSNFSDFQTLVESIHNSLHVWIGGSSGNIPIGSYDPINWPLAASIDLIWRAWQLQHHQAAVPEDILHTNLEPLGMSVADVLDSATLGYDYIGVADLDQAGRQVVLPGYFSDFVPPRPVDLLDLRADLTSLAWVIAARDTSPPLAIGLFGDWGSGKSTFMALLREQIGSLTGPDQPAINPWCTNVRQIVFNAWYYAEENIWASLVSHIFEELSVPKLFDRQGGSGLLGHIAEERAAANESLELATQREEQAQTALDEFSRAGNVFDAARAFGEAVGGDKAAGQEARQAQEAIGPAAAKALADAGSVATVVGRVGQRLQAFVLFLRTGDSRHRRRAAVLLGLALCLVAASALLGSTVGWPAVLSALAALGAFARAFEPLVKADQAIRYSQASLNERRKAVEADRARAAEQRAAAEAKLADIESGKFINDYFVGRAASPDYQGHLSLVSTVHRDFQDLSEWLRGKGTAQTSSVERIVLYIDDLDRCDSSQVVRVLEAIHLMLALDLFVVVVGVDPRWLLTSLADQYSRQIGAVANAHEAWRATPQQYLEKIFQIPFNLLPMDSAGFSRIIAKMLPGSSSGKDVSSDTYQEKTPESQISKLDATSTRQDDLSYKSSISVYYERRPPIGLVVEPSEIEFMSNLNSLIPTPRAAKRLVNTYRLLRARLTKKELENFIGTAGEPGCYRGVTLLLAVMIGHPREAERVFAAIIASGDNVSWAQLLDKVSWGADENTAQLIKTLKDLRPRVEPLPAPSRMKSWVTTVSRYSFRTIPDVESRKSPPARSPSSRKPRPSRHDTGSSPRPRTRRR